MLNRIRGLIVALALAVALPGCAALTDFFGGDSNAGAKTAIQFATLKVIDEDPARADRVVELVGEVRTMVTADAMTDLDAVEATVRGEVDWSAFDQAEQLVVSNLIDAVRAELEARISDGTLDADERVAVSNVLDWIEQAAVMAGGGSDGAAAQADDRPPAVLLGRGAGEAADHEARARPGDRGSRGVGRPVAA